MLIHPVSLFKKLLGHPSNAMPSIITHSIVGLAAGKTFTCGKMSRLFWELTILCAIFPDVDVIFFNLGISYGHFLGHRGFFHSLFFAMLVSLLVVFIFYREERILSKRWWFYLFYFFFVTASNGVLDAFTNGGLGVALLSPFSNERYFFPWRPIVVSPIGVDAFFSEWGLRVLKSEILWIWLPALLAVLLSTIIRRYLLTHRAGDYNK